ncbi:PREDICTED: uncharacterized protein LOC106817136, partial [Priapulus caudatus]|uniref:Uncharacterized protein LOC106817136 n=1 Tax=Priapulus caudatus TaxID=37621 RepID=A0ABM1EYJ8_PRICU
DRYEVAIRNRFQLLCEDIDQTGTSRYARFIEANNEAAKEVLTPLTKKRKDILFSADPRVADARRDVDEAYNSFTACDRRDGGAYIHAKEKLSRTYDEILAENLAKKVEQAKACCASNQHSAGWKLVREIAGDRLPYPIQIDGKTVDDRVISWYCHFKNLLGNPPTVQDVDEEIEPVFLDLPIDDGPITLDEYHQAKQSLKAGKSCGEDGVVPDVLRWVDIDDLVLSITNNRAHENREIPEQWFILNIIPIPKAGDLKNRDNYRRISLSSVVAKVYNRMILNRIRTPLDPLLRLNQNGFKEGKSITAQVLALRRLIEGAKKKNLPAVVTFVDFKKTFDSIHRGKLMKILLAYGIPPKIVQSISDMVVSVKVRLSLRALKKSASKKVSYNWKALENNLELQDRYEVAIRNRFQLLCEDIDQTVQDVDEEIEPVFLDLPIDDGPFPLNEYHQAKQSLKAGKSCGEDGVVPDVLRWVDIDDLVLSITNNRAHENREIPEQWFIS